MSEPFIIKKLNAFVKSYTKFFFKFMLVTIKIIFNCFMKKKQLFLERNKSNGGQGHIYLRWVPPWLAKRVENIYSILLMTTLNLGFP